MLHAACHCVLTHATAQLIAAAEKVTGCSFLITTVHMHAALPGFALPCLTYLYSTVETGVHSAC